jgi:hypothetical protein
MKPFSRPTVSLSDDLEGSTMTKYLASAAVAALIGTAAFASPAAAQVDIDLGVGGDRYGDDRYDGDRDYGDRDYRSGRPGVRIYSGRNATRGECYDRRSVRWVNGRRVVRTVRVCED